MSRQIAYLLTDFWEELGAIAPACAEHVSPNLAEAKVQCPVSK